MTFQQAEDIDLPPFLKQAAAAGTELRPDSFDFLLIYRCVWGRIFFIIHLSNP